MDGSKPSDAPDTLTLRPATTADVPALVTLENACFEGDRLTRRSFHHMITKAHAALLLVERGGALLGYALVLFHRGTSLARLYSLAVAPDARGLGLGRQLTEAAEESARAHDCVAMRLEVRPDNRDAIALYERLGYRQYSLRADYYEDHADALCLQKRIQAVRPPRPEAVPYYAQTTEFTCGAASLMMALKALDPGQPLDRHTELQLWREATTIFMTSGHGGCSPQGLALAAWRRGLSVCLWVNDPGPGFLDGVRSEDKKAVMTLVHEDFMAQIAETDIHIAEGAASLADLTAALDDGAVPLVLISSYRISRNKSPHWIVLTGHDERFIYAHDPEVDGDLMKTEVDSATSPFSRRIFSRCPIRTPPAPGGGDPAAARPGGPGMTGVVLLVDKPTAFPWDAAGRVLMSGRDYIARADLAKDRTLKVINLSNDLSYLGMGYYCSLLAEARGHRVVPSAGTLLDIARRDRRRAALEVLSAALRKTMARLKDEPEQAFSLTVFFGHPCDPRFRVLARQAFDRFRTPILRLSIRWDQGWYVHSVTSLTLGDLRPEHEERFVSALDAYTRGAWRAPKEAAAPRYALAILHDPKDPLPPSDRRALAKFVSTGAKLGIAVEMITKRDYARLAEYDALFIRETTAIDHHTFRFAQKAAEEGMAVIDDPVSILRCTNKVYLAELLTANKVPTPRTLILDRKRLLDAEALGYPLVLKIPDGSFSRGVVKVADRAELKAKARELFDESDLLLAQEYMYTAFDWRIGILDRKPLYAAQYHMAKKHWQIYKHEGEGRFKSGGWTTVAVDAVPEAVVRTALAAANLIGDGLYGVDLKQTDKGVFVIEVNDNPSLESGVEDQVIKDALYTAILRSFIARIERRPVLGTRGGRAKVESAAEQM